MESFFEVLFGGFDGFEDFGDLGRGNVVNEFGEVEGFGWFEGVERVVFGVLSYAFGRPFEEVVWGAVEREAELIFAE